MSTFGARRKARVIAVVDEDEDSNQTPAGKIDNGAGSQESATSSLSSKIAKKPLRSSGLRKVSRADINDGSSEQQGTSREDVDDEDHGPAVVRPNVSRSSSSKFKKRPPAKSSKLSFGVDRDDAEEDDREPGVKPKKAPLGQRAVENSATKLGLGTRGLPLRSMQEDDDRPRYSKEYLDELQSSTPNTPQHNSPTPGDSDGMDLDSSELDGAMIVETSDGSIPQRSETTILTEAEIQEKKERRARLAKEQDFLSVEDQESDDDERRKKKDDTRLMAEDEDMGEGFDNFVEDGGISLGKRAEKERRKQDRKQMAELITAAEGHSSDDSSDSDAERRIAYEAAQSRAGMDGLKKPRKDPARDVAQVPPKITPLPSLSECLLRLQTTLQGMEGDIKTKATRVQQLMTEKDEIAKRENEVQALLDVAGKKYEEAMGRGQTQEEVVQPGASNAELVGERGLESLGATPSRIPPSMDENGVS